MATPWFIATERFDPTSAGWERYIAWSGLEQLDEVVSLDASLSPTVLPKIKPEYWSHIVNEDFMLRFFTDLDYLLNETALIPIKNLLCVFRNPAEHPSFPVPDGFEFIGYDLVDRNSSVSALTNCGGFPNAFSNDELSEKGLIKVHGRSREVQDALRQQYPNEHHANCDLWAIFRNR